MPAVIIMQPGNVFPHLMAISDSRLVPTTVTPLYSVNSARNKTKKTDAKEITPDQALMSANSNKASGDDVTEQSGKTADPIKILQKMRAEHEVARMKRKRRDTKDTVQPVQDVREHILNVCRKVLAPGSGDDVRYHVSDSKGLVYLLITEKIAKEIGDDGMEWLRKSTDRRLRIKSGDAAEYLIVGNEVMHREDNP